MHQECINEIARVFFVNPYHGIVENPIIDANSMDFYGNTTLWCPGLNPVAGRYCIPKHESKERRYGTLAWISLFFGSKQSHYRLQTTKP